jgi:hypothetical protein
MRRRWFGIGALAAGVAVWLGGGLESTEPLPGTLVGDTVSAPERSQPAAAVALQPAPRASAAAAAKPSVQPPLGDLADAARQAAARDARGGCGDGRPVLPSWASATVDAAAAALSGRAVDRQRRSANAAEMPPEIDMPALREAQRARLDGLSQGGPLPQAAALLLKGSLDAQEASERQGGVEPLPPAARGEPLADTLAHLWRISSSLPLMRLALSECQRTRNVGCTTALVRDWTLIEPDNAAAWLWQATLASERPDAQAMDDAMYRASQASRMDSHVLPLLQVLSEPAFDAAGGAAAAALQIQWVGIVMAQVWPEFSRVSRYCETASLRDSNRAQRCEALARLLTERDGSLLGLSVGRGLGQRLGWSGERLGKIDQLRLAVEEHGLNQMTADPVGCDGHKQLRQTLLGVARHGEIGHHRNRIVAAGLTEASVAEAALRRRNAVQAAAAASAALEPPPPASPPAPAPR